MQDESILVLDDLSESEMDEVARKVSILLEPGDMLLLEGDLGMGKSTFARSLIRARLNDQTIEVPSPTFTIVQMYPDPHGFEIWHTDLYRLLGEDDIFDLGFEEVLDETIFLVEWPDRLPLYMQEKALRVSFSSSKVACRTLCLKGDQGWQKRLSGLEF